MGIYTYQNNRRQADMKKINWIENLKAKGEFKLSDHKINYTVYWAYNNSLEAENETLDLDDVVWPTDVKDIVDSCRENGIDHLTISSTFSSLITILAKFEELGCKMDGLTKVNKRFRESNGEREQIPALRMIIK